MAYVRSSAFAVLGGIVLAACSGGSAEEEPAVDGARSSLVA